MTEVPFPEPVRKFVDSTRWTFAKTYAATWPHEYIVRKPENAAMILALARHIFDRGVEGRFYGTVRKYHHEGGKAYWSMDSTAEDTNLINRCNEDQTYEARLAAGTLPKTKGSSARWRPFTVAASQVDADRSMGRGERQDGAATAAMAAGPAPCCRWRRSQIREDKRERDHQTRVVAAPLACGAESRPGSNPATLTDPPCQYCGIGPQVANKVRRT